MLWEGETRRCISGTRYFRSTKKRLGAQHPDTPYHAGRVHAATWHVRPGVVSLIREVARGGQPPIPEGAVPISEARAWPQVFIHLRYILRLQRPNEMTILVIPTDEAEIRLWRILCSQNFAMSCRSVGLTSAPKHNPPEESRHLVPDRTSTLCLLQSPSERSRCPRPLPRSSRRKAKCASLLKGALSGVLLTQFFSTGTAVYAFLF